jgi:hypothetical protein
LNYSSVSRKQDCGLPKSKISYHVLIFLGCKNIEENEFLANWLIYTKLFKILTGIYLKKKKKKLMISHSVIHKQTNPPSPKKRRELVL